MNEQNIDIKELETTLADLDETILAHLEEKEEEMMNTCKNCMHLCLCVTLEDSTWDTPVWECEINKEKTELDRTCKMFEQVDENEKYKFHFKPKQRRRIDLTLTPHN